MVASTKEEGRDSMKAEQKLAHQRLSVLELAEALGNVSEACVGGEVSPVLSSMSTRGVSRHTG